VRLSISERREQSPNPLESLIQVDLRLGRARELQVAEVKERCSWDVFALQQTLSKQRSSVG